MARVYGPWDEAEDQRLLKAWDAGDTVEVLAQRHERSEVAIRARLKMHRRDGVISSEAHGALRPASPAPEKRPATKEVARGGGPRKPHPSKKASRPSSTDAEQVRLGEAELDRRWELKKARTRAERARLSRQPRSTEAGQRAQEETQTRARLTEERRRRRDSQMQQDASREAERQRHERERLSRPRLPSNTPPPDPLPRSSAVTCIHNLPRHNCAHCTPRFLPPIRTRRW